MPWDVNHEMVQLQRPSHLPGIATWWIYILAMLFVLAYVSSTWLRSNFVADACWMAMTFYSCMGKMEKVVALAALPLHDRALEME